MSERMVIVAACFVVGAWTAQYADRWSWLLVSLGFFLFGVWLL